MTTADVYINRVLDLLPPATPTRDQIATELRGHIAERTAAGLPIDQVLAQLGDPQTLAESYLSAVPLVSATFGARAAAKLIDVALGLAVVVPLIWLLWQIAERSPVGQRVGDFLVPLGIIITIVGGSFAFAAYMVIAEAETGQTIGKRLMKIRVVRESGTRISIGQSVVRQLPIFFEFWWIDVLFTLFTEHKQRAFELLSRTRVVRV